MRFGKHRGDVFQGAVDHIAYDALEALAAGVRGLGGGGEGDLAGGGSLRAAVISEIYEPQALREGRHAALDRSGFRQRPEPDAVERLDGLAEHGGHAVGLVLGALDQRLAVLDQTFDYHPHGVE